MPLKNSSSRGATAISEIFGAIPFPPHETGLIENLLALVLRGHFVSLE